MRPLSSSASPKAIVITVPVLILSAAAATIFLFFLLSSLSSSPTPCSCSTTTTNPTSGGGSGAEFSKRERISRTAEDIDWIKRQIEANGLHMTDNVLRKGINPRTRQQQLQDLLQAYHTMKEKNQRIALLCRALAKLLVEEHHSYYGEPWAGGRDVFEFLAESIHLTPDSKVLEIGCGTLRVGSHFIRYLNPGHYHCLEKDELSLMAAFRYELPAQGLLHKRPQIVRGESMDFSKFDSGATYTLIYASAVFLHMPDKLVWVGLERLVDRLKPLEGRIFVSHNIKFCSRLGGEECTKKAKQFGT